MIGGSHKGYEPLRRSSSRGAKSCNCSIYQRHYDLFSTRPPGICKFCATIGLLQVAACAYDGIKAGLYDEVDETASRFRSQ